METEIYYYNGDLSKLKRKECEIKKNNLNSDSDEKFETYDEREIIFYESLSLNSKWCEYLKKKF
jgi:hypothetical protein